MLGPRVGLEGPGPVLGCIAVDGAGFGDDRVGVVPVVGLLVLLRSAGWGSSLRWSVISTSGPCWRMLGIRSVSSPP